VVFPAPPLPTTAIRRTEKVCPSPLRRSGRVALAGFAIGEDQHVDCIFCAIVAGASPAWRVHEDDDTVAFLDIGQATAGHTLVVPRRHAADIWSLSEEEAATVMRAVHRVAGRLRDTLRPEGLNVTQSNGAAAWQEVFHYHVHLVPRYGDDGLAPPWRPTRPSSDVLAAVHRRITGA
jgi:histidine triad (HIT) family protein